MTAEARTLFGIEVVAPSGRAICVVCHATLEVMSPDLDVFEPWALTEAALRYAAQAAARDGRVVLCDRHYEKIKP